MRILLPFIFVCVSAAPAGASNCFDHYNHEAWHGAGLAMVLCRNHSDDSRDRYIRACELRYHAGATIRSLSRHGSLDNGRVVYTAYNTPGSTYPFDVDIVCSDLAGRSYTFFIGNGASWADGCCRHISCGSVSCCETGCDSTPPPDPRDAGTRPELDAGIPVDAAACAPKSSQEYSQPLELLDVTAGSNDRLGFHIPGLPAPVGLTHAVLTMQLHDADHPGEEGQVYVNGGGPIELPAHASWQDLTMAATLGLPVELLQAGTNVIEFGAGSRDRTYYLVGQVALQVFGPACQPDPDPEPVVEPDADAGEPGQDVMIPTPGPQPDGGSAADVMIPTPGPQPDGGSAADVIFAEGRRDIEMKAGGCSSFCTNALPRWGLVVLLLFVWRARPPRSVRRE